MAQAEQIRALLDLKLSQVENELFALAQREAKLRAQVADLRKHSADANSNAPEYQGLRAIGAELSWNIWATGAFEKLNIELARLKARQMTIQRRHHHLSAQSKNVERLTAQDNRKASKKRASRQLEKLVQTGLAKRMSARDP